jgi:prolipoprotein diacylglyceryltransferase
VGRALVGGRILYLLQNELPDVAAHPLHVFAVWHGGLSFYGGLIAGLIGLAVWARRRGVGLGLAADIAAPAVAAGQAVGHIGCLIGGDSYGLPTTGPVAVVYENPNAMAPQGIALYPTQLYESVALALLALVMWASRGRLERLGPGATAALFLLVARTMTWAEGRADHRRRDRRRDRRRWCRLAGAGLAPCRGWGTRATGVRRLSFGGRMPSALTKS